MIPCDSLYLHHILSFLTDQDVDPIVLHVDNSAVRVLALKQGAGRLRHIKGRLLWLQSKVTSQELLIKQVRTIFNIADLNTRALNRDRFHGLLFMLGFEMNGERVGEIEFSRLQQRELSKQQIQVISRALHEEVTDMGHVISKPSRMNVFAKQVLRVLSAFSLVNGTEGFQTPSEAAFELPGFLCSCFGIPQASALLLSGMFLFQLQGVKWMMFFATFAMCFTTASGDSERFDQDRALSLAQSPIVKCLVVLAIISGFASFVWVIMSSGSSCGIQYMELNEDGESEEQRTSDDEIAENDGRENDAGTSTGYGAVGENRPIPPTLGSKYSELFSDPYIRAEG